jgi:hypothetical protein
MAVQTIASSVSGWHHQWKTLLEVAERFPLSPPSDLMHMQLHTYIHNIYIYIYIFTATWHLSFGLNIYVDGIFPWGACMAVHYIISKFWFRSYAESDVAEGTSYGRKSHFLWGGTI